MKSSMKWPFWVLAAAVIVSAGGGRAFADDDCGPRYGHRSNSRVTISYGSGYHDSFHHYNRGFNRRPYARTVYVVPQACPAPVASCNTVVINVNNENGSYTPVTLRQEGGTYVGPRGERYLQLPTEEQLKQVYGLK